MTAKERVRATKLYFRALSIRSAGGRRQYIAAIRPTPLRATVEGWLLESATQISLESGTSAERRAALLHKALPPLSPKREPLPVVEPCHKVLSKLGTDRYVCRKSKRVQFPPFLTARGENA